LCEFLKFFYRDNYLDLLSFRRIGVKAYACFLPGRQNRKCIGRIFPPGTWKAACDRLRSLIPMLSPGPVFHDRIKLKFTRPRRLVSRNRRRKSLHYRYLPFLVSWITKERHPKHRSHSSLVHEASAEGVTSPVPLGRGLDRW